MKFPEHGMHKKDLLRILSTKQRKNIKFSDGKIFGSMCAKPAQISILAYNMFIESNLGNPGLYPGTYEMEREVISMLGDLMHCRKVYGRVLSGGTEANITALWMYRNAYGKRKVILPEHAHFSFNKACNLLGLEPVYVKLDKNYTMDCEDLRRKIDSDVLCVVAVAGSTELGVIDNIPCISEICERHGVAVHVDAAFGGFIIPFLNRLKYSLPDFDFKVSAVQSITVDPHKMGQSVMPSGVLLTRKNLWKSIEFKSPYLTSEVHTTLLGTRASGAVAGTYAVINWLGVHGYMELAEYCMELTRYARNLCNRYGFEPVVEPTLNILALRGKNTRRIVREMYRKKLFVSYAPCCNGIRLVLMPYIKKEHIDRLFNALSQIWV
jgi:tyrosine decarboxylase/aspartate 1-decarboxylase